MPTKNRKSTSRKVKSLSAVAAQNVRGGKGTPLLANALTKGQVVKKVELHLY